MILILIIIIIIFIIFIINIIIINQESILHYLNTFNNNFNKEGLSVPPIIINKVMNFIKNIKNINEYIFIDFGCGSGKMIDKVYPIVNKVEGIEYNIIEANNTADRFKTISNIKIYPINMIDYKFKQTKTILYLYEPLWLMDKEQALDIYSTIFKNLKENKEKTYVIYCSATKSKFLYIDFFKKYNLKIIKLIKISRGIPFIYNNLYFLETS
jgi:hypothetical protein